MSDLGGTQEQTTIQRRDKGGEASEGTESCISELGQAHVGPEPDASQEGALRTLLRADDAWRQPGGCRASREKGQRTLAFLWMWPSLGWKSSGS